jgi:hypothetical protein
MSSATTTGMEAAELYRDLVDRLSRSPAHTREALLIVSASLGAVADGERELSDLCAQLCRNTEKTQQNFAAVAQRAILLTVCLSDPAFNLNFQIRSTN